MTEINAKVKLTILILLLVVPFPLIIFGIIYLTTISMANIWGWVYLGFGLTVLGLVGMLLINIRGTASSRYDAAFEVDTRE
ncbi:MAG TPA: hypothetical protein VMZ29_12960 [Candidatus Bathyarchaeia archaeon]|nr:hypothetical protein [Candidatus Bathyarchaeia archaeon]